MAAEGLSFLLYIVLFTWSCSFSYLFWRCAEGPPAPSHTPRGLGQGFVPCTSQVYTKHGFPQAYGVIGGGPSGTPVEAERVPAVSLTLACLPGADVAAVHLMPGSLPDADAGPAAWRRLLGVPASATEEPLSFFVISSPDYMDLGALLQGAGLL